MNSIGILHGGKEHYYTRLSGKDDYYTKEDNPEGIFYGKGSARFGLENERILHKDERLKNMFQGKSPDGEQVLRPDMKSERTYREYHYTDENGKLYTYKNKEKIPVEWREKAIEKEKKVKSVIGYDNVFSAPKDVSILWSQADGTKREMIHTIHKTAVKEAIDYLEKKAAYTRTGRGGTVSEKVEPIIAALHHTTSRSLDPQLHTHVVFLNCGYNSETKKWGALDGKRILNERYTSGMIYQNSLRQGMEKEIGVKTYDRPFSDGNGVSFGIEGISESLREQFSKRSQQIEKRITSDMTGAEVRAEVLKTRPPKPTNVNKQQLAQKWKLEGLQYSININQITQSAEKRTLNQEKLQNYIFKEAATKLHYLPRPKEDEFARGIVTDGEISVAILSAAKGRIDCHKAFELKQEYIKRYTIEEKRIESERLSHHWRTEKKAISTIGNKYYGKKYSHRQNAPVSHQGREKKLTKIITAVVKAHVQLKENYKAYKVQAFKRKIKFLYYTGQVSRKQYLQMVEGKKLPTSKFVLRTQQALGLVSKRSADAMIKKMEYEEVTQAKAQLRQKTDAYWTAQRAEWQQKEQWNADNALKKSSLHKSKYKYTYDELVGGGKSIPPPSAQKSESRKEPPPPPPPQGDEDQQRQRSPRL